MNILRISYEQLKTTYEQLMNNQRITYEQQMKNLLMTREQPKNNF